MHTDTFSIISIEDDTETRLSSRTVRVLYTKAFSVPISIIWFCLLYSTSLMLNEKNNTFQTVMRLTSSNAITNFIVPLFHIISFVAGERFGNTWPAHTR